MPSPRLSLGEDSKDSSITADHLKEQPPSSKDEKLVSSNISQYANVAHLASDALGSMDGGGDGGVVTQASICAPQPQPIVYHGYENATNVWEDYHQYVNIEDPGARSTGVYNENPSLVFHTGYGYSPQFQPYGPYSPVTTPLPSASGDSQLYSQQFPFTGPYYQPPPTPSMPYQNSPTFMSQADLTMPSERQGTFLADNSNTNSMIFGPTPDYQVPYSPFGRGSFAGNSGTPGFYDLQQGFDGFGSDGFQSDWLKSPDGIGSLALSSSVASPHQIGAFGSFGQGLGALSSGMGSQQQSSMYAFGSSINLYDRGYFHGGMYHQGSIFGGSVPRLGANGQSFIASDKGRRHGRGNVSSYGCNGSHDFLNEQNRGPRATRPKNAKTEQESCTDNKNGKSIAGHSRELYNDSNFSTEHKDAKFFIIKSYSEDNVHKSIKYGVWASTTNGNKKLDSAYREAKEKDPCPVFLFFSVNASSQFCGVAEMMGPVDFEKSVSYWQHDKWSGQFPVKWHIVKDVPNNLFRHIILENNDNKPVTNSRDTQEVKLEQGLEMLSIFKKHESEMSILDDFDFYEERQKAMQVSKACQQQSGSPGPDLPFINNKAQNARSISDDAINQMSNDFDGVIRLQEGKASGLQTEENATISAAAATSETEDCEKSAILKVAHNV